MVEPAQSDGAAPVQWVRKRSGEIVPFDQSILARSLQHAAAELNESLETETAEQLAAMAAFFVASRVAEQTADYQEISDWTEKSLRETGHQPLADAYARYRQRKRRCRQSVTVLESGRGSGDRGSQAARHWDKDHIVRSLRQRLDLQPGQARQVASRVERRVVRAGFDCLSSDLVRELVNQELASCGVGARLRPRDQVVIPHSMLRRELAGSGGGLESAGRAVLATVLRQFALDEVVSPDVAEATAAGLLYLPCLDSPAALAAAALNAAAVLRQSADVHQAMARLGRLMAQTARSCAALIAVDLIEPCLALCADFQAEADELAERFWQELTGRLRPAAPMTVLNLYGGFPRRPAIARGAGPLFEHPPGHDDLRLATAVCEELLGRFQRDAPDWPALRLDWHWAASQQDTTRLTRRVLRLAGEGYPVGISFERRYVPLAEGLRRRDQQCRPLLTYAGIGLPVLWRQAGSPTDLAGLEQWLCRAVRQAVRAAVQQREFMRRLGRVHEPGQLDRAALAVFPVGLDWLVRRLAGAGFCEHEGALRLAESLVQVLRQELEREARHFALPTLIDAPPAEQRPAAEGTTVGGPNPEALPGLVPSDAEQGPRRQMHAAARLHAIAGSGTLNCPRWPQAFERLEQLQQALAWAAEQTQLVRLRFPTPSRRLAQSTVAWPD